MSFRICIYYKAEPEKDLYFKNDYIIRRFLRKILGRKRSGGVQRVYLNLLKSLKELGIQYSINKPFHKLKNNDIPIVLGRGKHCLKGYNKKNKIIAGIALMTHPSEWPNLCKEYPVIKYLQHSEWANNVYTKYYGNKVCDIWFSGIDTEKWIPNNQLKKVDFLIYLKFLWNKEEKIHQLLNPIISVLESRHLSYEIIQYGNYREQDYYKKLISCKSLLFLSEHESQGFACCEAMSMDVPILAWDQEFCMDPNRFKWNDPIIPATSVPFFSDKCGITFKDFPEFEEKLKLFIELQNNNYFEPREYVVNNLSLEKSGKRMIEIIRDVYPNFDA